MVTEHEEELIDLSDRLLERLHVLLERVEEKQEALLHRNFDRLEQLNDRQTTLLNTIRSLRREREQKWAHILGVEQHELSNIQLENFFSSLDGPVRSRIKEQHTSMKQLLRDVQRKSDENASILHTRLSSQEHLLSALSGDDERGQTYDRSRDVQPVDSEYSIVIDQEI